MIINTSSSVENNTGLNATDYKLKASAQAFKILSSSLYEDKPKAVLRELSANALDAHIAAGCPDTPIKITLPTALEPELKVEDFGIGLSKEQMENIYTTYFESTKSESNDEVGGFGLGSKSPFAIAESFTVVSVKEGELTEAINFTDNGVPKFIITNHVYNTAYSNGTIVKVPVESNTTINALQDVARFLFKYWKVQPTILNLNGGAFTIKAHKTPSDKASYVTPVSYSTWKMDVSDVINTVTVGPFDYVIPYNVLKELNSSISLAMTASFRNIMRYINTIEKHGIVIDFNVGDIEIAPSRERIEDTVSNRKIIVDTVKQVISEIIEATEIKAKEFAQLWVDLTSNEDDHVWDRELGFLTYESFQQAKDILIKEFGNQENITYYSSYIQDKIKNNVSGDDSIDPVFTNASLSVQMLYGANYLIGIHEYLYPYKHSMYFGYVEKLYSLFEKLDPLKCTQHSSGIVRRNLGRLSKVYLTEEAIINKQPRFILSLTENEIRNKGLINNALKNDVVLNIAGEDYSVNFDNYRETGCSTNFLNNVLEEACNYYKGYKDVIHVITLEDLLPFVTKTEKVDKVTGVSAPRRKLANTPLGWCRVYSNGDHTFRNVTVNDLYGETIFNDDDLVITRYEVGDRASYTETGNNTRLEEYLSEHSKTQRVFLFTVGKKELNAKRFEALKDTCTAKYLYVDLGDSDTAFNGYFKKINEALYNAALFQEAVADVLDCYNPRRIIRPYVERIDNDELKATFSLYNLHSIQATRKYKVNDKISELKSNIYTKVIGSTLDYVKDYDEHLESHAISLLNSINSILFKENVNVSTHQNS